MRVKTPTIYQMEMTECGAASLGMILAYYGYHVPLEQLRVDTGVTRDGCNALHILKGARKYGLQGKGLSLSANKLKEKKVPCIIHWNFNHFVVFEGIKGDYAYINDPAQGRRKMLLEEFESCFTGITLLFEKTESFQKNEKTDSMLRVVLQKARKQSAGFMALVLLGLLMVVPGFVLPQLSQVFVDQVLNGGKTEFAGSIAGMMLLALGCKVLLQWYRDFIREKLSQKLSILSARNLTEHILKLPIAFFEQRYLGDIVGRSDSNDQVNEFMLNQLVGVWLDLFTAVFYLVILMRYHVVLTMIGLAGIAADLLVARLGASKVSTLSEKNSIDEGKLSGMVLSALSISETLKAAGAENDYTARIIGQEAKCMNTQQETDKVQNILSALAEVLKSLFDILILLAGGYLVICGEFSAGMLVGYIGLFEFLAEPMKQLIHFVQTLESMKASMNRVEDVERYPQAHTFNKKENQVRLSGKLSGEIEVKGVTFGYNPLFGALISDFGFHIESGKTIALVGASGSGKSTVGKLLSGLYLPWEGNIYFDGMDRERIPANVLNASIATVSQNVVLFGGTIRQNLTMWNKNILEEDMIRAAKDACIHDTIMSKTGAYDYVLNENAGNLSGGQRQRLEIARALATNPSILIMDEATSALDTQTEKQIIDNIKRRGCSCVIVAHRLSAIRDCDEIVVLLQGKVVQRGTHEQLMNEEGYYQELVRNM
ncbi:MAG: NHLP family bacteriocin export ABC transporter peptidase/permease/ATPase subunit [Lachnospiraceae bacterium]|nr:NHLP family bacteriocin export ABC transporter peptidase/permease/ATPase subunit [Lachnospiraceae bacterium]